MPRTPVIRWRAIEKYGDAEFNEKMKAVGLTRMFLHAHQLSFTWPDTGVEFTASAPLPADLGRLPALHRRHGSAAERKRVVQELPAKPALRKRAGQPDQRQSDDGGRVLAIDAFEQRDARAPRP